ncbi:biopolymer transporter ExbD [Rhodobacteraceae bacterium F11138]|nr:biopolymer transporter ExbD [Rhodobacteraceae bacterium F11138]
MNLSSPTRRPGGESIVPMINVVFLLLIFFLMTSQVAPPDPIEITAPQSGSGGEPVAEAKLYLDAEGVPYFGDISGDAVFEALTAEVQQDQRVLLAADRQVEAAKLAALMRRLAGAGLSRIELIVSPD